MLTAKEITEMKCEETVGEFKTESAKGGEGNGQQNLCRVKRKPGGELITSAQGKLNSKTNPFISLQ